MRTASALLRGLGPFLKRGVDPDEARSRLEWQLKSRHLAFGDLVRRAVFENTGSPYRRLLDWAGITLDDVTELAATKGVEGALRALHDHGVYVTLEEFKGLRPLSRPGLELELRPEDFDNPLATLHYTARTSGSRGGPRRILVDLDLLEHESAYHALFLEAAHARRVPLAIWHPAPPGAVGIKNALIQAKLGRPPERWFSQTRSVDASRRHELFTGALVVSARLHGSRMPRPEHTPAADVGRVVDWLAQARAAGTPPVLITTPSACVRTCREAIDTGRDISDTLFVLVGEPFTAAKAEVVAAAGARAYAHYAMAEAGLIGLACQDADALDDVHLTSDKVATIQGAAPTGRMETTRALFHTTISPASPKVMLNVESGDMGVIERRECGCGALPRGYRRHLHSIRSYEKLTSEGMCFLGDDLFELIERVLPTHFGGRTTDYQLTEHERDGLPVVGVRVSSSVGPLEENAIVGTVLSFLRDRGVAQQMMAEVWEQGHTLRLERGDPHATASGKILPLHTLFGPVTQGDPRIAVPSGAGT